MVKIEDTKKPEVKDKAANKEKDTGREKVEPVMPSITVEPLEIEIGYSLIPLVDPEQGGTLLDRITNIRRISAINMGLIVPPISIRDNLELEPPSYSIMIRGVEVGHGELQVGKLMAMDTGDVSDKIEGIEFVEPTFGLKAIWIDPALRDAAEKNGYTVVDSPSIIATHLTEIIKKHAAEILGRQEVQKILDNIKKDYPAVVDDMLSNKKISLTIIQRVLQNLLRERVSIRNIITIFETLANYSDYTSDPGSLTEYVRTALSRQICKEYLDKNNIMSVITVDPEIESVVRSSIYDDPVEGKVIGLDSSAHREIMNSLLTAYNTARTNGFVPVYLVTPHIRSVLFTLMEREVPDAVVLSYNEISQNVTVKSLTSAMLAEIA